MRKKIFFVLVFLFIASAGVRVAFSENKKKNNDQVYKQFETFSNTMAIIQKEYVSETKINDLVSGALKGMLSSLDAHSQFMDADTYADLRAETQGKFGGIGIEITIKDGLLTVITPIDDTPAAKAGIKAGDRIVKINDIQTRDLSIMDAVKKLRGAPGTEVNLSILRDNEKKLLDFKINRAMIKITDIKYVRILEEGIGYVRISEFRETTLVELNNALSSLAKQGMRALIIDLRNNPGGLLDVAVKVAGKFLESNKLVAYTKGRQKSQNLEFFAGVKNFDLEMPLAIIINEGSASGSEIVAGALQDYKRAIIVGKKSFGKGSVQTVIPLNDGTALRLTTSHYFTPSGKIIQGKGVVPDIAVEQSTPAENKNNQTANEKAEKLEDQNSNGSTNTDSFNYKSDMQLLRSIDALKVMQIYKPAK